MPHSTHPARVSVADLPEALARIAEDRDWAALEALCDQHVLAVEGERAGRLLVVLDQVPHDELRARPRLMISWISAYHAMNQPHVSELRPHGHAELGPRLAAAMDIATRRGPARSPMDDFPAAVAFYRQAYERATAAPDATAAALDAAANLAMIFGHLGHGALAHQWLGRMRGVEPRRTAGGTIAEGWDALDRYDEAGLAASLEITGDDTVWPFAAALTFAHGLYLGDPPTSLAKLGALRFSHSPELVDQATAAGVVRRAHVELLTATGQATRALRLVKEADPRETWPALPAARLRLLNGEYEMVRAMASRTSWHETASRRDARQMLLLKAIAALRMGDRDEARRSLVLVGRVRTPDEVLSLASLSPADRDELIRLGDLPLTDEAARRLAGARPVFPDRVELVELTAREQVVLTELDAGLTVAEVARKLVVSVNTVRTQVKSAYRKLGASSREGALMRAYELGVL